MSSVLGVSVGASAIRMARSRVDSTGARHLDEFDEYTYDVGRQRSEDIAAESVGVALETSAATDATALAYRNQTQGKVITQAMQRQQLENYRLVPEVVAAMHYLHRTGDLDGLRTVAVYDLGSSGLTVSVYDAESRSVLYSERSTEIGGDYFDALIREQQIAAGRITPPQTHAEFVALDVLCRQAKEQLSQTTGVALPSAGGLVLLSRENFDTLVALAIESSVRLAHEVIEESEQPVQAVVAVGGGARIPLVQSLLHDWTGLPVVVPTHPELAAARGAALLAEPVAPQQVSESEAPKWLLGNGSARESRRQISGAGLAVTSLAVIAAIGIALGYGGKLLQRGVENGESPTTTLPMVPPRTTSMEPSIAVAPIQPPTPTPPPPSGTANGVAPPEPSATSSSQAVVQQAPPAPSGPPPQTIEIPGLPVFTVPTLPPPPPLPPPPQLPPLPPLP